MDVERELPADLAAETEALRRVARAILFEPALAEDAVQDAWLAALRTQRVTSVGGGWLTESVKRIARGLGRNRARRATRELAAARAELQPSAAETASRLELLHSLLDALERLDEPYRTAVRMRWIDDLPPRAIAERLSVPVETVRTRLKRGLEKLRAELDLVHRDRRDEFLAALVPLIPMHALRAGLATGALSKIGVVAMDAKLKLAVALVALAAIGAWWKLDSSSRNVDSSTREPLVMLESPRDALDARSSTLSNDADASNAAPSPIANATERIAEFANDWIVRGKTTLGRTRPLPDATVELRIASGHDGKGEVLFAGQIVSGHDGSFAKALPRPNGPALIVAQGLSAPMITPRSVDVVLRGASPPKDLEVAFFERDLTVRGRVLDGNGVAIVGAKVSTWGAEVASDANGRFELRTARESGRTELRAWSPGFAWTRATVESGSAAVKEGVELRLPRGLTLHGRVVDEHGAPVEGAQVSSYSTAYVPVATDAAGRFELDGNSSQADVLDVRITADGFADFQRRFDGGKLPEGEVDFALDRGVSVRGRVIDQSGAPIAEALVFTGDRSEYARNSCYTDDDGRFELAHVQADERELGAKFGDLAAFHSSNGLPNGELLIRLTGGRIVRGMIVDELGAPIAGVRVSVSRIFVGVDVSSVETGGDGRFELHGVPLEPRLTFDLFATGYVHDSAPIADGDEEQRIVLRRAGGISGTVIDAETREPVAHFRIKFGTAQLESGEQPVHSFAAVWRDPGVTIDDAAGHWTTHDSLTPGEVTSVEVLADGYAAAIAPHVVVERDPDPSHLVVALRRPFEVRGVVVDRTTGEPIASALVERFTAREPIRFWSNDRALNQTRTNARGEFVFRDVADEPLSLFIEAVGHAATSVGPFAPGSGSRATRIELVAGASIVGVIADENGKPIASATVLLSAQNVAGQESRAWRDQSDSDGHFTFHDLSPGFYMVCRELIDAQATAWDLDETAVVEGCKTTNVELRPRGHGRISGRLTASVPLPKSVDVSAWRAEDHRRRATLAVDGRFEFTGLEAGHWTVSCSAFVDNDSPSFRNQLEFDVDDRTRLDIELPLAQSQR